MGNLPKTQCAVQLVGPSQLTLNREKPVPTPGAHQIVVKSHAVGLCFSDLKLLKQFDQHVRKGPILSGISPEVLAEIPTYVPEGAPTVPGHEVVCEVVATGDLVESYHVGDRFIVQADYRPYKTAGSNGAFGYNFEGGLQEFILLDERVIRRSDESAGYMIRVDDSKGLSAVALVEPWACVENSYATAERRTIKPGGKTLIVADDQVSDRQLDELFGTLKPIVHKTQPGDDLTQLPDEGFDDIVSFGHDPAKLEILNDKLGKGAVMNVVLGGNTLDRPVTMGVGRIHYGGTRWIGTIGTDPLDSYRMVPPTGEIRPFDRVLVVGAGGPMGQMHVIRALSLGFDALQVVATDVDDARLEAVVAKVQAMGKFSSNFCHENISRMPSRAHYSYFALMAPIPALLDDAIRRATPGAIVNLFAGIPAPVKHPVDLDVLIEKEVFVFGTSGSETSDMRVVLDKVQSGRLDTNLSVGAVSGMAGALDGLAAVENRTLDGKIIVYPTLPDVPLLPLGELVNRYPTVAARLNNGHWTAEAETEFLAVAH